MHQMNWDGSLWKRATIFRNHKLKAQTPFSRTVKVADLAAKNVKAIDGAKSWCMLWQCGKITGQSDWNVFE